MHRCLQLTQPPKSYVASSKDSEGSGQAEDYEYCAVNPLN